MVIHKLFFAQDYYEICRCDIFKILYRQFYLSQDTLIRIDSAVKKNQMFEVSLYIEDGDFVVIVRGRSETTKGGH